MDIECSIKSISQTIAFLRSIIMCYSEENVAFAAKKEVLDLGA